MVRKLPVGLLVYAWAAFFSIQLFARDWQGSG